MPECPAPRRFHTQLALGALLTGAAWIASWSQRAPLAQHSFFPLWLGYILIVDALSGLRTGSSLVQRSPRTFVALFGCSIPFWWVFELLNARLRNWSYLRPHHSSWLAQHAEASLAFSTVVPAIFVTAELYATLLPVQRRPRAPLALGRRGWWLFVVAGMIMLALVLAWPRLFFPLAWISLFFIVDPLVHLSGGSSIATRVARGCWRTVGLLYAAGLTCGFFWEMWNSRAMPKWTYHIPYADWLHIFEMPMLGYGGYLPFALETYAIVKLIDRLLPILDADSVRFDKVPPSDPAENRS